MTGDLNDGIIETTKRSVNKQAIDTISALRMYPKKSLIVAMYGATIGKTGILSMDACTNQACCVLADPKQSIIIEFIQAVVIMARSTLIEKSYGGGQPNINSEIVRSLKVPLPPLEEQEEILYAIKSSIESLAITHAHRQITLLQEYRTRLIADVVTGKLDVREAAAHLPEESGESKLFVELDSLIDDETSIEESESEYESDEAEA
jgi:Restriction endonuclease S subunits